MTEVFLSLFRYRERNCVRQKHNLITRRECESAMVRNKVVECQLADSATRDFSPAIIFLPFLFLGPSFLHQIPEEN